MTTCEHCQEPARHSNARLCQACHEAGQPVLCSKCKLRPARRGQGYCRECDTLYHRHYIHGTLALFKGAPVDFEQVKRLR
jgi:hypothetical protein